MGLTASTTVRGLEVARCVSQRARNSATNAVGSMSSCCTSVLGQNVEKKLDSIGSRDDEQPARKNGMDSIDSRLLLEKRNRNRPSQSGISHPMNSSGCSFS